MAESVTLRSKEQRKGVAQRPAKHEPQPQYAPEPTAAEYKTFPAGYRLEYGSWPAEEILEVKGLGGPRNKRKYLIQWHPHPFTGQYFEPSWVSHGEVTEDLLASWEESSSLRKLTRRPTKQPEQAEESEEISDNSSVRLFKGRVHTGSKKRRRSSSVSSYRSRAGESLARSPGPSKRQKVLRVVPDGTSDAEEEITTQNSSDKSQATVSTSTGSLQSPPPEIDDSQESETQPRPTVSVVVPGLSSSQAEQYLPVNLETESSNPTVATPGDNPSAEATASDYPTPQSEQLQSPAVSDTSFALFFPETTQSPRKGSPLVSRAQKQISAPPSTALRAVSKERSTQISGSNSGHIVLVHASGEESSSGQSQAPFPSAQVDAQLPTSSISEIQIDLGTNIQSLVNSEEFETAPTQRLGSGQTPISQSARVNRVLVNSPRSTGSTSPLKRQISPSQRPKQTLFRTLHTGGIESWPSQQKDHIPPLHNLDNLQSLFSPPRAQVPRENRGQSAQYKPSSPASAASRTPPSSPFTAMAAPTYRSSPRTGGASTPSRTPRGMTLTLQEQLAQSRDLRQRNAQSASPVEAPAIPPVMPQIRQPTPVRLNTRTSNPALLKTEMPEPGSSSAMQVDEPTSPVSNEKTQTASNGPEPSSSLPIQESIEMDEPDKLAPSTQDSSVLDQDEAKENGQIASISSQGLMPNYPILLPAEFAIPLHAEGKTQHAYREAVHAKQKAILKYLRRGSSSSTPSSSGVLTPKTEANEMAELVTKLDSISTLMDLGYDGMLTQSSFSGTQLARWAVKASSKFAFVKEMIDALQLYECSIIIFAKAGPTQQVFENFFNSYDIGFQTYKNSGEATPGPATQGKATIHLISGGQRPKLELKPAPTLIIAFDNSYDPRSEYVLNLRGEEGKQIPAIHLLVANSSEHIERCLPVNMPSPQRNRLLVQSILRASPNMGKILSDVNEVTLEYYAHLSGGNQMHHDDLSRREQVFQKMPDFHLKRLTQQVGKALIDNEFSADWSTSPPMPPLTLDDIPGLITQPLRLPSPSPIPASPIGTPSLRKRLLDGDVLDTPGGSKRQRLTPVPGASSHEHTEASQIYHLQQALKAAREEAAREKLGRMGAEDAKDKVRNQLNEWRQSVSELQKRVEYHRELDHKARTKAKQTTKEVERLTQLRERDTTERDALKLKNKQLQDELTNARNDLISAGDSTAALEEARAEARTSSTALAKAQRDLESSKQQAEYFRIQYQETMATGRQHQADAEELQAKVHALEIDASDEKRRLKHTNYDEAADVHLRRIEKLELEKRALETMLKKLNTENVALRTNRGVSTRASSAQPPGSPRTKSRAASPVPGLMAAAHAAAGSRASALRHER